MTGEGTGEVPFFSETELEAGRLLFEGQWTFLKGVVALDGLPSDGFAEVAFVGRSNGGKSSLINALVRQNGLARTSNTPGRTQELNYFQTDAPLYIVDMPGYGYAKVSRSKVEAWTRLIKRYLQGRVELKRVFVLVDSRHGLKESDTEFMALMDRAAVTYQIVLTKIDKLKRGQLETVLGSVQAAISKHPAAFPHVMATSAEKGDGIDELRAVIAQLANIQA